MAQTITNQAGLSFTYNGRTGTALSNVATVTLAEALGIFKNSIEDTYTANDELTFTVAFTNNSAEALTNVTLTDDVGTYSVGGTAVTPLTFVPPALIYIDGVYSGTLTPTIAADSITFTLPSLAAGAHALIIYKAQVNGNAHLAVGTQIINTVTASADELASPAASSNTVAVDEYADVSIIKSMSPSTVEEGSPITYDFTVYNHGNTAATGIVLTDTFTPAPTDITVTIEGTPLAAADYTYTGGVLTLPTGGAYTLSLDPAAITQSPTGEVTVVPSSIRISVTGTL